MDMRKSLVMSLEEHSDENTFSYPPVDVKRAQKPVTLFKMAQVAFIYCRSHKCA